jgi:hypothetical protein
MNRLARFKTYNCTFSNNGNIIDWVDVTIQSYFRLSDSEFGRFFNYFTLEELSILIPSEENSQPFSKRRKVSQLLTRFYNEPLP